MPPSPTLKGVDIYHGDGPIQFHDLMAAGVAFIFLKATQGLHYTDPAFADNWGRAKEAGLLRGAYHFFDPGADPVEQADHFCHAVNLESGDIVLALDVETEGVNIGKKAFLCASRIKELTGYWPILYASDSFYQSYLAAQFPPIMHTLWIARYGHAPVTKCAIWQYSDSGRVQNVRHALDTDVFYGSRADLLKHTVA